MTALGKTLLAAAVGITALAGSAVSASAFVACSGNTCWHVKERHNYPASAKIVIHDDNWKWKRHEHYRWREHEGRGYWHGGRWTSW
jgi:hypothetical protein